MRQPKTSTRKYAERTTKPVTCGLCSKPTTNYRLGIVGNRPVFICTTH